MIGTPGLEDLWENSLQEQEETIWYAIRMWPKGKDIGSPLYFTGQDWSIHPEQAQLFEEVEAAMYMMSFEEGYVEVQVHDHRYYELLEEPGILILRVMAI